MKARIWLLDWIKRWRFHRKGLRYTKAVAEAVRETNGALLKSCYEEWEKK